MRAFISIFLLLIVTSVEARMYQWVHPNTGRTQLSGKAPSWYRSEAGGPRVLVFEKNVLVDDTAVNVTEDQRELLRSKALPTAFAKQQEALKQQEAIAKLEKQIEAIVESPEMEAYINTPAIKDQPQTKAQTKQVSATLAEAAETSVEESVDERVERLKALISAWDQNKTKHAKSLLDATSQGNPTQAQPK